MSEQQASSSYRRKGNPLIGSVSAATWRYAFLGTVILAVAGATIQVMQPYHPGQRESWFFSPIRFNKSAYLPDISRNLYAVAVQPGMTVWIGGEQGFLASSDDRGMTWTCYSFAGQTIGSPHACNEANAFWLSPGTGSDKVYAAEVQESQMVQTRLPPNSKYAKSNVLPPQINGLSVSVKDLDFGNVVIHETKTLPLTIRYAGTGGAAVKIVPDPGNPDMAKSDFSVAGYCDKVAATAPCSVNLHFAPDTPGKRYGTFLVQYYDLTSDGKTPNDIHGIPIEVRGVAIESPVKADSNESGKAPQPDSKTPLPVSDSTTPPPQTDAPNGASPSPPTQLGEIAYLNWGNRSNGELIAIRDKSAWSYTTKDGGKTWAGSNTPIILPAVIGRFPCASIPEKPLVLFEDEAVRTIDRLSAIPNSNPRSTGRCFHLNDFFEFRLHAAVLYGEREGWAVGGSPGRGAVGVVHKRTGFDSSFQPITRGAAQTDGLFPNGFTSPARWFYIAMGMASFFYVAAVVRRRMDNSQTWDETPGIAGIAVSDRPLEPTDAGVEAMRIVADGIARFFRNPKTSAPLVLCINGGWGTGKSSLMNLLADDLRYSPGDRRRVICFNAWHHQSEEQILASLLQSLRKNALRPASTLPGFLQRLRLFVKRWPSNWFPIVLFAVSTYISYYLLKQLMIPTVSGQAPLQQPPQFDMLKIAAGVPALLTAFATAKQLLHSFTGFLSNPASLLSTSSGGGASKKQLEEQTTLRDQFARDFKTVTDVLGNGRLVLFIDDLDRCAPEKIREVVEAINFLVSAGNCFIVLGMDSTLVENYLGQSFEGVVKGLPPEYLPGASSASAEDGADAVAARRQVAFARRYLQKLIQLQFNLRPFAKTQALALFPNDGEPTREDIRLRADKVVATEHKLRSTFRMIELWALPIMGSLSLILATWIYKNQIVDYLSPRVRKLFVTETSKAKSEPESALKIDWTGFPGFASKPDQGQDATPARSNVAEPPAGQAKTAPAITGSPLSTRPVADTTLLEQFPVRTASDRPLPGEAVRKHRFSGIAMILTLMAAGTTVWLLARRILAAVPARERSKDSLAFVASLRNWTPVLIKVHNTPRTFKLFLNKVRFLAMLQRAGYQGDEDLQEATLARRFALLLHTGKDSAKALAILKLIGEQNRAMRIPAAIPDQSLVALSALDSLNIAIDAHTTIGELVKTTGPNFAMIRDALIAEAGSEELEALNRLLSGMGRHSESFRALNGLS